MPETTRKNHVKSTSLQLELLNLVCWNFTYTLCLLACRIERNCGYKHKDEENLCDELHFCGFLLKCKEIPTGKIATDQNIFCTKSDVSFFDVPKMLCGRFWPQFFRVSR